MKVLALHSSYQLRGGEDESFAVECQLLENVGCSVSRLVTGADMLTRLGTTARVEAVVRGVGLARVLGRLIEEDRPDVAYVNNTFPSIGPAVTRTLRQAKVPMVVAIRNYRFECIAGTRYRRGAPCSLCTARGSSSPGIVRGCYRGSPTYSAVASYVAANQFREFDRSPGTQYACVSEFVAKRFVAATGVSHDRVHVKPNTTNAALAEPISRRSQVVVVGRLEPEKGTRLILECAADFASTPLVFVGDGSLRRKVESACASNRLWSHLGVLDNSSVLQLISESRAALIPSMWDEPFGRVAVEALSVGTPVVVTNRGGLPEVVGDSGAGVVVDPGSPRQMVSALTAFLRGGSTFDTASVSARQRFAAAFSPHRVGETLIAIFKRAMEQSDVKKGRA